MAPASGVTAPELPAETIYHILMIRVSNELDELASVNQKPYMRFPDRAAQKQKHEIRKEINVIASLSKSVFKHVIYMLEDDSISNDWMRARSALSGHIFELHSWTTGCSKDCDICQNLDDEESWCYSRRVQRGKHLSHLEYVEKEMKKKNNMSMNKMSKLPSEIVLHILTERVRLDLDNATFDHVLYRGHADHDIKTICGIFQCPYSNEIMLTASLSRGIFKHVHAFLRTELGALSTTRRFVELGAQCETDHGNDLRLRRDCATCKRRDDALGWSIAKEEQLECLLECLDRLKADLWRDGE